MSSQTPHRSASLHALYTSPRPTTHLFQHQLSSPLPSESSDMKAKTSYLSELKNLITTLQGEINTFLTERMEEDKKSAEAQGKKVSEQEAKEEENYGEEVVEDDA